MSNQGPIKVSAETKEKVRYVAAMNGSTQADVVRDAVDEYVGHHGTELAEGISRARIALAKGTNATVAHVLGIPEEQVDQVADR